ncbi:MAG: hypothetical protein KA885_02825 [Spirochaetes bacterium]|nr:hypothetical protein [Spirochaetota bacterium]
MTEAEYLKIKERSLKIALFKKHGEKEAKVIDEFFGCLADTYGDLQRDFANIVKEQLDNDKNLKYYDADTLNRLKADGDRSVEYIDDPGYYTSTPECIATDDEIENNNLTFTFKDWTFYVGIAK